MTDRADRRLPGDRELKLNNAKGEEPGHEDTKRGREESVLPADREAMRRALDRWNAVSKPRGSLGELENLIVRIAGAQGTENIDISRRVCVVFAADNGIAEERVTQSSRDLTATVARHIANGCGNINTMAKASLCDVICVDVGIDSKYMPSRPGGLIDMHVSDGTGNFLLGPAMTKDEVFQAHDAGYRMAERISREGYRLACAGEMGIGNTTTATAVIAALLKIDPADIIGRGGGLDDEGLARKLEVIRCGLRKYRLEKNEHVREDRTEMNESGRPDTYAWDVMRYVGGLDIAAMAGFYRGCAVCHIPVILDGLIAAAAALIAAFMDANVKDYLIASHNGRERGVAEVLKALGLRAVLHADLALGEGSGAVLLLPILDVANAEYRSALTFADMGLVTDDDAEDGIRVFTGR